MTSLTIRPATEADATGIARVHVDSWRFAYRGLLPQKMLDSLSVDARADFWRRAVTHPLPRAVTLVAMRGDCVVGFCNCGPARDDAAQEVRGEIAAIYVLPDSIRQGIGRRLMDAALDHLAREGFSEVILWVLEQNSIGVGFYQQYGWMPTGETKAEVIGGVEVTEAQYQIEIERA